jgi:mitogen-activated protein kinase 1/3
MVKTEKFIVDCKYHPLKPLGHGAYGVVCSALNKVENKRVAIKKIGKAFDDLVDAKRILRELRLLRHFQHENVVGLLDLVPPLEDGKFEDMYVVMDLMDSDLHKIIYSKNSLSDDHIQYFIYQTLRGMKYIHSANVLHRDLKPANLLLNANCDLKICDFGLARGFTEGTDVDLTEYVVTRWYRAPEVMCACNHYDAKIDVWAIGCILGELHGRKPLFPGDDYMQQMELILQVLGTPTAEELKFITNAKALQWIQSLTPRPKVPLSRLYPNANPLALDLMDKMLKFDPNERISVTEALAHPYFKKLHREETEPNCARPFEFNFEAKLTPEFLNASPAAAKSTLQEMMWHEITKCRPHLATKRRPGRSHQSKSRSSRSAGHS